MTRIYKASTVFLVKIVGKTGNLQKQWKSMHSQYPRGGIEKKSLEIIGKTKVSQYPRDIGNTLAECTSKSLEMHSLSLPGRHGETGSGIDDSMNHENQKNNVKRMNNNTVEALIYLYLSL